MPSIHPIELSRKTILCPCCRATFEGSSARAKYRRHLHSSVECKRYIRAAVKAQSRWRTLDDHAGERGEMKTDRSIR
jgi:hypothetical protein